MKKKTFIAIVLFILISGIASGMDWYVANQGTFTWLPVTTLQNGDPLPEGSIIKYEVYQKNLNTNVIALVGETDKLIETITFTSEGQIITGVKTLRYVNNKLVSESRETAWSNDPKFAPNPFGFTYYLAPSNITGMERE